MGLARFLGITGHSCVCAAGYRWDRLGLDIHNTEKSFHYDMAIRDRTSYRQVLGKERAGVRLTDRRKVSQHSQVAGSRHELAGSGHNGWQSR
jgi:hypothetical protein